jgi:hypothetical protein
MISKSTIKFLRMGPWHRLILRNLRPLKKKAFGVCKTPNKIMITLRQRSKN